MSGRKITRDALWQSVEKWQKALGLDAWTIVTKVEVPPRHDDGAMALMSISRHHLYDDAVLYVHPWCVGEYDLPDGEIIEKELASPFFFEYKVVHELLHLVSRDMVMFWTNLDGYLHRDVVQQLNDQSSALEEQFVDRLAKSLVFSFGAL